MIGNLSAKGGRKYPSQDIQVSRTTCHAQPSGPKSLQRWGPAPHQGATQGPHLYSEQLSEDKLLFSLCKNKLQGHKLRGLN